MIQQSIAGQGDTLAGLGDCLSPSEEDLKSSLDLEKACPSWTTWRHLECQRPPRICLLREPPLSLTPLSALVGFPKRWVQFVLWNLERRGTYLSTGVRNLHEETPCDLLNFLDYFPLDYEKCHL